MTSSDRISATAIVTLTRTRTITETAEFEIEVDGDLLVNYDELCDLAQLRAERSLKAMDFRSEDLNWSNEETEEETIEVSFDDPVEIEDLRYEQGEYSDGLTQPHGPFFRTRWFASFEQTWILPLAPGLVAELLVVVDSAERIRGVTEIVLAGPALPHPVTVELPDDVRAGDALVAALAA